MKLIPLTQGKFAKVDDGDFDELNKKRWRFHPRGYACCSYSAGKNMMHNVIMCPPIGLEVDHINRDKLDNTRANLRLCTKKENMRNRGKFKNNKSGYLGVHWSKDKGKWRAACCADKKHVHIGYFSSPELASEAYLNYIKTIYGDFVPE